MSAMGWTELGPGTRPRHTLCRCDCGVEKEIFTGNLRRGVSRSCGHDRKSKEPLEQALWRRVAKVAEGCWEWTGAVSDTGYGAFVHRGQTFAVHRLSWELHNGSIPDGMYVCHRCDNRRCVRPDHLFIGSSLDNNRDMHAKGRFVPNGLRGETHPNAKLTSQAVIEIRRRSASGALGADLAKAFGVTDELISQVVRRKIWRHV